MYYGAFELSIKCPKCDGSVVLNGPLERAHCDQCQNDLDIPHDFWDGILDDCHEEMASGELADGEGRNSTIFGTYNVALMYGNQQPRCHKCKTTFAVKEDLTAPYEHTCEKCGTKIPVAPAPEWLKKVYPPVRILANALLVQPGDGEEKSAVSGPVAFTCPQCGGALMVDGKERMMPCKYCGVNVYLPDDLWLRLHPAKVKGRWYVGFEGKPPKEEE